MNKIYLEDIQKSEHELREKKKFFLLDRGWQWVQRPLKSINSYWCWNKDFGDVGEFTLKDTDEAIHIESMINDGYSKEYTDSRSKALEG